MKTQQYSHPTKILAMLLSVMLIVNLTIFTETLLSSPAYAEPSISEMNVNTTDNEVSVYGTGTTNVSGAGLAEKPYRYSIDSNQSDWLRDTNGVTINETLTSGALNNTSIINNKLTLTAVLSGGGIQTATGSGLEGYSYSKAIIIDHNKIESDLSNLPVTVYLNNSNFDFAKVKPDGSDIRFTDLELNELKFEKEEYASGSAVFNILVPTVSSTQDTPICMWYGNPNAYNTSIESWQDQTGKQITYNGNVKLVPDVAKFGKAAYFDGSGDYFNLNGEQDFAFGTRDFCIEMALRKDNSAVTEIYSGNPASVSGSYIEIGTGTDNIPWVYLNNTYVIKASEPFVVGQEYKLKVCRQGTSLKMFINDIQVGSTYTDTTNILNGALRPLIGGYGYNPSQYSLNGSIYGIRITKGRSRASEAFPSKFDIDGSDVVFCTNFDTIYDKDYAMIQHMGSTLVDATGNGNNGIAIGTTVLNTEFGEVRSFNGSNEYITMQPNATLRPARGTFLANINYLGDDGILYAYGKTISGDNRDSGYYVGTYNSKANFYVANSSNAVSLYSNDNLVSNNYYCITGRYDGLEARTFIDGTKQASAATIENAITYDTTRLAFAMGTYPNNTGYNNLQMSEARISSTPRSDAWIKAESLSLKNQLLLFANYSTSGYRESGIYDISGCVNSSKVEWTQNTPTGTAIKVETNVSLDGGSSWLGWKAYTSGGIIADLENGADTTNARLKLRQTLTTSSSAITPSLSNSIISIGFGKYAMRASALPNTEHTVTFEVKDANGSITTETKKVFTKAQTPVFTVANATINTIDLVFTDANPSHTEYQIMCDSRYVNSSGVLTSVPTWIPLNNKSITILGLNIGTMYNFSAKARNTTEEETNYGSPLYTGTQGIPVPSGSAMVAATALNNSITVAWNEIPNLLSYELEMDGVVKNVGTKTYFIHKDLMTSTQHAYRVRGKNLGGYSQWSELYIINTTNNLPLIPTNVVAKASNHTITVYWSPAQDALTYTVEIAGTQFDDVQKNSASLFGLQPKTTYTYKVKACNLIGESAWTTEGSITTAFLDTPQINIKEKDSNQIKIGWEKIKGATSYKIALDSNENFKVLSGSDLDQFASSSSITFTHENLPIKTAHVYRVCAINSQGESAWSDSVTLETLPQRPAVPTNFRGNATNNFITLMWDAVQDAIGYDLEVDGIVIENGNTPMYRYKGLDQYTEHTYHVRSVTNEIQSNWSDMLRIWTSGGIPDEPKNVVITNSRGIATIDWEKTPGAQSYDVEVGGNVFSISENTFESRNIGLITSSSSIYKETAYRIRAGNDLGKSDWTDYYINNAILGQVEKGKELDLGLTASNIMDFSRYTLYVNYNEKALTVTDLCAYSVEKELAPGIVEGHDIEIVSFVPGHIVFRVNKIVDEGYLWTGIINNIKFSGNATGGSTLTYTAQCSKE